MAMVGLLIRRGVRDPRLRFLLVVLLLLVAVVLAWHLVGMADHTMMMLSACFALVAAAVALLLEPRVEFVPMTASIEDGVLIAPPPLLIARGRYPPDQGTVLRD